MWRSTWWGNISQGPALAADGLRGYDEVGAALRPRGRVIQNKHSI
jgi:hypothetical protein